MKNSLQIAQHYSKVVQNENLRLSPTMGTQIQDSFHVWVTLQTNISVGTESDQLVNICSFAVRCDRRWLALNDT